VELFDIFKFVLSRGFFIMGGKMNKGFTIIWLLIALLLTSCSAPSPTLSVEQVVAQTMAAKPQIIIQTVIVVVTATPLPATATPSTPTLTPEPSSTPAPNQPPLYTDKTDGNYLIGKEIGYGTWRTDSNASDCYWAIETSSGGIIDNDFGQGGTVFTLNQNGFILKLSGCGITKFLQ
jgi:hypothetical protein